MLAVFDDGRIFGVVQRFHRVAASVLLFHCVNSVGRNAFDHSFLAMGDFQSAAGSQDIQGKLDFGLFNACYRQSKLAVLIQFHAGGYISLVKD